jgi:hypothetical protein
VRRIGGDDLVAELGKVSGKNDLPIPDHLVKLYENACEGRTREENMVTKGVLLKYRDTFSKEEDDVGLTHLAEHSIDTGNARPVKLPPRRVPLAFAEEER